MQMEVTYRLAWRGLGPAPKAFPFLPDFLTGLQPQGLHRHDARAHVAAGVCTAEKGESEPARPRLVKKSLLQPKLTSAASPILQQML